MKEELYKAIMEIAAKHGASSASANWNIIGIHRCIETLELLIDMAAYRK